MLAALLKQADKISFLINAHCLVQMPYRSIVFDKVNKQGTPLYLVAGSDGAPCKASKALKRSFETHGSDCFYCNVAITTETYSRDHVDPLSMGGSDILCNLVIACKKCNGEKNNRPLDIYKPEASKDWLTAKLSMIEQRLKLSDYSNKGS